MAKEKSLQELQEEIVRLEEKKEQYKNKEKQLRNREKQLRKMANIQEQKRRTHRLIERGALLESFIEGASCNTANSSSHRRRHTRKLKFLSV